MLARLSLVYVGEVTCDEVRRLPRIVPIWRAVVRGGASVTQPLVGSNVRTKGGRHPIQRENCPHPLAFFWYIYTGWGAEETTAQTRHPRVGPGALEVSSDNVG